MPFCMFLTCPHPANPSHSDYRNANVAHAAISVTLTPVGATEIQRHLTLTHGNMILIGRASKSEAKNLQPQPTNALFDCPVVSREHAELEANKYASPNDQITITDKGSMHGTYVNGKKLHKSTPMSLRSGDLLQFGTSVTRGHGMLKCSRTLFYSDYDTDSAMEDTHDGIYVTFDRITPQIRSPLNLTSLAPVTRSGYHYPSDNESLVASDDDASIVSVYSDNEEPETESSAKTTPEQVKSQPGSAQQPIDLESVPSRAVRQVISLDDDNAEDGFEVYEPQSPTLPPRPRAVSNKFRIGDIIQDSITEKNDEIVTLDSVPGARVMSPLNDEESVLEHNTGLVDVLTGNAQMRSEFPDEDEDSEMPENPIDAAGDIEEVEVLDDDDDGVSDSDVSDYGSNSSDLMVEAGSNSYSAKKQVSPELGSAPPVKQSALEGHGYSASCGAPWNRPANQLYYDPVRGSRPSPLTFNNGLTQPIHSKSAWYEPFQPYATYHGASTSGFSGGSTSSRPAALNGSRWDQAPRNTYNTAFTAPDAFGTTVMPDRLPSYEGIDVTSYPSQQPSYSTFNAWNEDLNFTPFVPRTTPPWQTSISRALSTEQASTSTKNPMKISEMVEKNRAVSQEPLTTTPVESPISVGKKRKAVEMTEDVPAVIPDEYMITASSEDALLAYAMDEAIAINVEEPPARRRKIDTLPTAKTGSNVAGEVVKYAAAVAVGGVGTMAFLCSPLAERLLEYLA